MDQQSRIEALLDRLARLRAAAHRSGSLNEVQRQTLIYLSRANRFSRTPSAVADWLATTRGTASQTLQSLLRRGLVEASGDPTDGRGRVYSLTEAGRREVESHPAGTGPELPEKEIEDIARVLELIVARAVRATGAASFGFCPTCRHHRNEPGGASCALLGVALSPEDAGRLCREHARVA